MPWHWRRNTRGRVALRALLRRRAGLIFWIVVIALAAFLIPTVKFFRTLTGTMAVSNASDLITQTVSDIVNEKMRQLNGENASFVTYEKDAQGNISAITTDTARVNALASELLTAVVQASDAGDLDVYIPLGDLVGMSFFLGKGPKIPVKITLLTSSRVNFRNVLSDAGINQTKHQLLLVVQVDADVLLPWEIRSTQVITEVLVSETIVVGEVPEAYVSIGEK